VARALLQAWRREAVPWGKHLLLSATAATGYVGIVLCHADYAFTLTNVLSHGIPYAALVLPVGVRVRRGAALGSRRLARTSAPFLQRARLSSVAAWLVPLLAVPQLTHYVLDGLFWRRASNANLRQWFRRQSCACRLAGIRSARPWPPS
jgi:hypothetical protein